MAFQGLLGIGFFVLLAFIFSEHKSKIDWKIVVWGLALQLIMAGVILGSFYLSLSLFSLFIFSIITYNVHVICNKKPIIEFLTGFLVTSLGTLLFVQLIPNNQSEIIRNILWNSFLFLGALRVITGNKLKKFYPKYWANIFGILVCLGIYSALIATEKTGANFMHGISQSFANFMKFSEKGGKFLFGDLFLGKSGWVFAIVITSHIIFFSALVAVFDSLGLLNQLLTSISRFMTWTMKFLGIKPLSSVECVSGISSISMGVNVIFIIKNYLEKLTKSEIMLILTSIMATISANMFFVYVSIGISPDYLLAASVISVPAVIVLAKILVPETEQPITQGQEIILIKNKDYGKPFCALLSGVEDGIKSSLFLCGVLIAFTSIISLFDNVFLRLDTFIDGTLLASVFKGAKNSTGEFIGIIPGSLQTFFGFLFSPLAFFIGIAKEDALKVGYLMGTQMVLTAPVAFTKLMEFVKNNEIRTASVTITSFALCGFANPCTMAIILGTVLPYVKDKKQSFIYYGIISLFIGACASWMTASIASLFANSMS